MLAPPLATGGGGRDAGVAGAGPSAEGPLLDAAFFVGVLDSLLSLSLDFFETARPMVRGMTLLELDFFLDFFSLTLLADEEASSFLELVLLEGCT